MLYKVIDLSYKVASNRSGEMSEAQILFPPSKRTIFLNISPNRGGVKCVPYFLSFPSMLFNIGIRTSQDQTNLTYTYCFFVKQNKLFLPPLPNTYDDGSICLGIDQDCRQFESSSTLIKGVLDAFWTVPFTCDHGVNMQLYNTIFFGSPKVGEHYKVDRSSDVMNIWRDDPELIFNTLILTNEDLDLSSFKSAASFEDITL